MKNNRIKNYTPALIEKKWSEAWEREETYKTPIIQKGEKKKYILSMFPYPSGSGLHTGHTRIYTGCDVLARYYRMKGFSVLHPMGWDAFGLPAENAAIKLKRNPKDMVSENISNFKRQMKMLGFSYDWEKEFSTTDPLYYKWTQWLFIQFFKAGLLFKKDSPVYFCEHCKTNLAEEEVLSNGMHERCEKPITRKNVSQWIFRITKYSDSLLNGLKELDWPKGVIEMQRNWIGKKEGVEIFYDVVDPKSKKIIENISCFTTRPETNFGATFIVLAPEHKFVSKILNNYLLSEDNSLLESIKEYVSNSFSKTDVERLSDLRTKTGVFTGFYAINKLTGRKMPIWISDFVLKDVGTGAVVGVPGHDVRDFEFARTFNIEVIRVILKKGCSAENPVKSIDDVYEGEEGIMINSGFLNGMSVKIARKKIIDYLSERNIAKKSTMFHLHDWIFSRQRYWGEPIPMIFCEKCYRNKISYWSSDKFDKTNLNNNQIYKKISIFIKDIENEMYGWFPVPEKDLPVELPDVENYEPRSDCKSPLEGIDEWKKTKCPNCGSEAFRETDTMPNWAGSCWYFLYFSREIKKRNRYVIKEDFLSEIWKTEFSDSIDKWLPVDWYIGGKEHAVLHLLYARFWMHVLRDLGFVSFREPFKRFRDVGIVLAEDHRKMSKSFGNVVNPDDVVKEYGADALRVYEMFMAPFEQEISWSTKALQGAYRFLKRIWQIYNNSAYLTEDNNKEDKKLVSELQNTISKVTNDIPNVKFNTSIAAMMKFLNLWCNGKKTNSYIKKNIRIKGRINSSNTCENGVRLLTAENAKKFIKLLAPFAPFIAEEIWRNVFKEKESIHKSKWPDFEENYYSELTIKIPVQVNGRFRDIIEIQKNENEEDVVRKAISSEKVSKWIGGRKYRIIYIKEKILNLVIT